MLALLGVRWRGRVGGIQQALDYLLMEASHAASH